MFETPGIYNCSIYFNYPFAETKYLNITFDITSLLNFYIGIKYFTQIETNINILSGNYDLKYYVGGIYKVNNPYNQHDGNKYLEVYCPSYYCKDNISVYMIGLVFSDGNNIELGENIDDLYDEYNVYKFELLNVKETEEYNINLCEYPDYIDKEYETGYNSNSLGFITGYAKKPCDICLSTVISPNLNKNNITELKYFENNSLDEESVLINVSDSTFTPVTGISNISFEYIPTSQFESIEMITGKVGTSITSSFNILPSTSVISNIDIFDNLSVSIDGQISGFVENANVTVERGILALDMLDVLDELNQISTTISLNPILSAVTGTAKVPLKLYNTINNNKIELTKEPIIYQFNYEFINTLKLILGNNAIYDTENDCWNIYVEPYIGYNYCDTDLIDMNKIYPLITDNETILTYQDYSAQYDNSIYILNPNNKWNIGNSEIYIGNFSTGFLPIYGNIKEELNNLILNTELGIQSKDWLDIKPITLNVHVNSKYNTFEPEQYSTQIKQLVGTDVNIQFMFKLKEELPNQSKNYPIVYKRDNLSELPDRITM
jgi:hypothetical protein